MLLLAKWRSIGCKLYRAKLQSIEKFPVSNFNLATLVIFSYLYAKIEEYQLQITIQLLPPPWGLPGPF